jgi:hypothetical protein
MEKIIMENRLLFWNKIKWNHAWLNNYIYKPKIQGVQNEI